MAEAKSTKTKKAKPKKAKAKGSGATKAASRRSGGSGTKSRNGAAASGDGGGTAAKASSNGSGAANTVGAVAEKAKLPLLATGAVIAGAAAVIATKSSGHKQRKVLGVTVPKHPKSHLPKVALPKGKELRGDVRRAAGTVTDVARQADQIGKRISKVANSVQAVGEATDDAAKKS